MKENKVRLSEIIGDSPPETEANKEPRAEDSETIRLSELKNFIEAFQFKTPAEKKDDNRNRNDLFRIKDLFPDDESLGPKPVESLARNTTTGISHGEGENKVRMKGDQTEQNDVAPFCRETIKHKKAEDKKEFAFTVPGERPISTAGTEENFRSSEREKADSVNFPGKGNVSEIYNRLITALNIIKAMVKSGREFSIEPVSDLISHIVGMPDLFEDLYKLTIPVPRNGDYNILHQVNTMVYALKIGRGLSFNEKRLHELALSALLHDIGMFLIPENITGKDAKLTTDDLNAVKQHPIIGKKILETFKAHPWTAEVAYHHHERENGQGYPQGLLGDQISEYAKIVGIVDGYESMTHNRPYRKALKQAFSAKELIKSKNMLFSPPIVKVFLKEISLYPLGSFVRLNNKAIGQVIGTDRARPLRPDVKIFFDGEGNRVNEPTILRLDQNSIYFIQDSVSEDELPGLPYAEPEYRVSG